MARRKPKSLGHSGDRLVVLCGAGISIDPPSHLPSGGELLRLVIEMLLDSADIVLEDNSIRELHRITETLRLELGLEVLARHIPLKTLVQVYAVLQHAVPNYNHLVLAAARVQTITTNQDTLIEDAADRLGTSLDILHIHGRADRPTTVITLISQYMAGLPRTTVRRIRESLDARHVLVLGYSGRDRDVMDVLQQSGAAHIQWVQHPGSTTSQELQALQNALRSRLTIETGLAHTTLAALLTPRQKTAVSKVLHTPPTARPVIASDVRAHFATIARLPRNLSLAAILRHASRYDHAERIYNALGGTAHRAPATLLLAMASARAYQQHFDDGLAMFSRVLAAPDAGAPERSLALLGQVEILRNSSRGRAATRTLDKVRLIAAGVRTPRERNRILGRAATQTAGIASVDGDLPKASSGYATAIRCFDHSRDLNEQLESQCWRADVLRKRGHYNRAHAAITAVLQESMLYVRHRVRAWAYFVSADIDAARGDMAASERSLDLAADEFRVSQNPQALIWTALIRAAHRRLQGQFGDARRALDAAGSQLRAATIQRHLAQSRLNLEYAELARSERDYDDIPKHIEALHALLRRSKHFSSTPTYLYLHALLVQAESQRDRGRDVADALSRIARDYEELGFNGCAARARVAAWSSLPGTPRPPELLRACRNHGRKYEVALLERRTHGLYPIYFA